MEYYFLLLVKNCKINSTLRKHICWKLIAGISSIGMNRGEKTGEEGVLVSVYISVQSHACA